MRKVFGVCSIILGICCLISSVVFIVFNRLEEGNAQKASEHILQDVRQNILNNIREETDTEEITVEDIIKQEQIPTESGEEESSEEYVETPLDIQKEMLTTKVSGYDCIGILSIPVLGLELPVLTDWSYAKLKVAPCHYYGSYFEEDFVIAAHNYQPHFGRLPELQPKDLILFTDISGTVYCYEVVLLETLPANATLEMITSGFDLSLYTCTLSGTSRITVRCNATQVRND